jgi:hypothetical protein
MAKIWINLRINLTCNKSKEISLNNKMLKQVTNIKINWKFYEMVIKNNEIAKPTKPKTNIPTY